MEHTGDVAPKSSRTPGTFQLLSIIYRLLVWSLEHEV